MTTAFADRQQFVGSWSMPGECRGARPAEHARVRVPVAPEHRPAGFESSGARRVCCARMPGGARVPSEVTAVAGPVELATDRMVNDREWQDGLSEVRRLGGGTVGRRRLSGLGGGDLPAITPP